MSLLEYQVQSTLNVKMDLINLDVQISEACRKRFPEKDPKGLQSPPVLLLTCKPQWNNSRLDLNLHKDFKLLRGKLIFFFPH